jgi:hypothetical protein
VTALGAALAGCGDTVVAQPGWVAAHPSTALVTFETSAPGVCAITVQYPQAAPSSIEYLGSTFVQVSRQAHPQAVSGHELGHSGDWDVRLLSNGNILVVTPGDAFEYRLEAAC